MNTHRDLIMNERIRDLMTQAGFDPASIERMGVMPQAEKFAELIIKECAAVANYHSDGHEKDQFGRKMFHYHADIGEEIHEYFGVDQ